jgi:glycosyltransferase involved in cell wall biosynthesis
LTTQLVLDQSVHFLGQRTDVPAILHASTVVIQAAVSPEAFGLATLEGMAAGKPVVASRLGGVGEIITDGVTGILVPPGQPAVLGRCIVDLLANPERRAALAAAAAARTLDFTAAETARGVQAAWDEVAARSTTPHAWDRPSGQAPPSRAERLAPERAR